MIRDITMERELGLAVEATGPPGPVPDPRGREMGEITASGPRRDLWAVVLAGGEGRRLECFVRQFLGSDRPKQFCRIVGSRSMLRHTWDRAARVVDPARIVTVITTGQERYVDEEACDGLPGHVLVQPENKDTAPGLLLPLLWIGRRSPGASVVVFPADHFVWEEAVLAAHVRAAAAAAEQWPDRLALLGVEPDGPEVGYGWIAPGVPLAARAASELYTVRRFWEKPDRATATRLFGCGYFWNTLILVGRLGAYLSLAEGCMPDVLRPLRGVAGSASTAAVSQKAYRQIPPTNLSRALLARRPEDLMVVAARGVYWSDWGDPDRIVQTLRRFDRRPTWLPVYARARIQAATGP